MFKFLLFIISSLPIIANCQKITPGDSLGREIVYDTTAWIAMEDINLLKTNNISFKKPDEFTEVRGFECFKDNPKLEVMLSCAGYQLCSKNREVVLLLPFYRFLTESDSVEFRKSFPKMLIGNLNYQHARQIRAQILNYLGKDPSLLGENKNFEWEKYVTYYPSNESKSKFNADTAISYLVTFKKDDYYKGIYKYMKALVLQKNGRGFVEIFCFYTESERKKLFRYWKSVERIYKYED
ncbi:MAG: hypothetical protein QM763_18825 [Agriterribacter sp.]